jgi:hypothetical protein
MNTDTPRTDAHINELTRDPEISGRRRTLDFARTLERELNAARAELAAIADIAHAGGLQNLSEVAALIEIRKRTATHWRKAAQPALQYTPPQLNVEFGTTQCKKCGASCDALILNKAVTYSAGCGFCENNLPEHPQPGTITEVSADKVWNELMANRPASSPRLSKEEQDAISRQHPDDPSNCGAQPQPLDRPDGCAYTLDQENELWDTACGRAFTCITYDFEGVPAFCPGCGRRVVPATPHSTLTTPNIVPTKATVRKFRSAVSGLWYENPK